MSKYRRELRRRQARIDRRFHRRRSTASARPVMSCVSPNYEVSSRTVATRAGGIGAIHAMAQRLGLILAIDERLHLLKRHLPYHESDHVLWIAYNLLADGRALQGLEERRRDEAFTDMLGATRLPDPTTAGDFLRRFDEDDICRLMDLMNEIRASVWRRQPEEFRAEALIDIDGVVASTTGEKKEDMEFNYAKKTWGYHPLLISLANSREPLYTVNRPGNVPSHTGAAEWLDRAIKLVQPEFGRVRLRGDTDFSLTGNFDRWTEGGVRFVFGCDAHPKVVAIAEGLESTSWARLQRSPRHEVTTAVRQTRPNAKEQYIHKMGWRNLVLDSEDITEVSYRPLKCSRDYRLIILRKNIRNVGAQQDLFGSECRYFFYVTNDPELSTADVVRQSNLRCDQENLIEQLKTAVGALKAPVHDLLSNWTYMVIASLAWSLKAWFALTCRRHHDRAQLLRMEFRQFLEVLMLIPAQIVRTGRRLVIRILAYTSYARLLFRDFGLNRAHHFT